MRLHWDVGERRRGVSLEPPSSLLSSAGKLPAKPRKPAGEGKAETPGPAENQGPAVNLPLPDRAQNTGSNPVHVAPKRREFSDPPACPSSVA